MLIIYVYDLECTVSFRQRASKADTLLETDHHGPNRIQHGNLAKLLPASTVSGACVIFLPAARVHPQGTDG